MNEILGEFQSPFRQDHYLSLDMWERPVLFFFLGNVCSVFYESLEGPLVEKEKKISL